MPYAHIPEPSSLKAIRPPSSQKRIDHPGKVRFERLQELEGVKLPFCRRYILLISPDCDDFIFIYNIFIYKLMTIFCH